MKSIVYIFLVLSLLFIGCNDEILFTPEKNYGINGRILNESGDPIPGVKIYCLFDYYYIPNLTIPNKPMNEAEVDSFGYSLYQNFPNPIYNSSFLRYSIASDMDIELTVKECFSGTIKYVYSGYFYYGLYQHHFNEIVNSLQLENGCYSVILKVSKNGIPNYEAEKKMFVISDIGKANSVSDGSGKYIFDYKKACIGDTLFYTTDGENIYPNVIDNQVNLLFKKDGFLTEIVSTTLYSEILLDRDVILKLEE